MKFQDLLVPFLLALVGTAVLQYFFFPKPTASPTERVSDRRFVAPTSVQVAEPLDLDIDFYDAAPTREKEAITLNLPYGTVQFSNDGAIIDFMGYKRQLAGKTALLETVTPSQSKESGAFLVALDGLGKTPYYYNLIENKELDGKTVVTYKAESDAAIVTKKFELHHDTYVIDLELTLEPKEGQTVRPRIFFPAPLLDSAAQGETKAVISSGNYLTRESVKDLLQVGVENPSIVGLEDKYFALTLFNDPQFFAQRAYFKTSDELAQTILQSGAVSEKTTWNISFYSGPKELAALSKVDVGLEGLLSYGWFAPISKLLLYVLIFLYGIFSNYGIAIIVLTILIRLLLVPFSLQGEKTRRKSQEAQKKLQYIEQRYKNDPEALAREKANFAREQMTGMVGCLPMLLQFPIFIGLQRVLAQAIELYKAPFLWISDLSSPDPYYILPIFVGLGMAVQMAQVGDVRQRVTNLILAIVIAAITANLSAGLTLYIGMSSLLAFAQTYIQKALTK